MSFRGRGAKSRGAAPPPNLIALGGRGRREVRGRPGQLAAPSSTGLPAATQHGISSASLQQSSLAPSSQLSPTTVAEEFVQQVLEADASEDIATVNDMLLEALLVLKSNPTDPDRHCYLSLLLVAKRRPSLFGSEKLFEALLSLLHRDSAPAFKRNNLVPVLACNILYSAFQHRQEWPLEFVQVYMDDVLGARVWVEDEYSKAFVQNVQTCFPDPLSPMDPLLPNKKLKVESGETSEETPEEQLPFKEEPINRYPHPEVRELIRRNVIETLNYYLHSQAIENARNLIKLLTITAGYKEARMFGSQYLEDWLSNASTVRYAKEYIPQLAQACNTTEPEDLQALNNILTLKVKGLHAQLFLDCISVLLRNNKEYPAFALKSFIHHEVLPSLQKGTPNIKMLATIFHTIPEHPELELSFIFAELAANDEYTPILKPLLSKVVKAINTGNTDFCNFVESFVQGLMQERQEMFEQELSVRERWVINLVELICYSVVLSVPAQLLSEPSPSSKDNLALLRQFRFRMARIQKDCMVWCHSLVYRYLPSISPRRYSQIIHRLLFLEHLASYIDVELTPEVERGYTQLLFARVPVLEDTITLITVIHLTGQPLYNVDALECMDRLLKRAAAVQDDKAMEIKNVQLVEAILKLTIYTPPSSDKLQTPSMQFAVTSCFWKACLMLLLIASHNPQTIGQFIWQEFPTAKLLMEMLITRHYHFPPMHWSYTERVEAEEYELQQQHKEKAHIIELENRIANVQRGTEGKIIDEANSVLLHQLIEHNPYGHVRCPSATVLDDLRNLDLQYRLGHKLCSNRNPDYLLDIMQRHGALESMKWLGPIIQAEPETLDVLPVSCLCELLLTSASPEMVEDMLSVQLSQELRLRLISRLLLSLKGSTIEPHSDDALQIFSFFLQKLSARQLRIRHMGRRGLALLLYSFEDASEAAPSSMVTDQPATAPESIDDGMKELPSGYEWLQTLSKFPQMAQVVQSYLYRALLRETEAVATYSYLVYLSYVTRENGVQTVGLANEVGRMIVTRSLVAQQLLKDVLMYSRCLEIMSSALEYLSSVQQENLATLPLPIVWLYPSVEKPFPLPAMVLQGLLSLLCLPLPYLQEKKEEEKQKDSSPLSPALLLHSNLTSLIIGSVDMKQTLIFADAAATQQVPFPSPEQAFAMTYSSHPLLVRAGVHALGLSEKLRLLSSCWGLSKEGLLQVLADLDDIAEHHRDALLRQIAQLQQPIQLLKQAQRCLLRLNTSKGTLFINAVQGLFSEQWPEKSMASAKPTIMRFLPDEFLTSSPLHLFCGCKQVVAKHQEVFTITDSRTSKFPHYHSFDTNKRGGSPSGILD
ncbi:Integrator complex subunit 1 [Balamuthia mandrillaris]